MSKTHLDISKYAGGRVHKGPLLASRGMKPGPLATLVRQLKDVTNSIRRIKAAMVDGNYTDAIQHFEVAKQKYHANIIKNEEWSSIGAILENLEKFFQSSTGQLLQSAKDKSLMHGIMDLKEAMSSEDDITYKLYRRNAFVLLRVFTPDEIISASIESQKKDEISKILNMFCPFQHIEENLDLAVAIAKKIKGAIEFAALEKTMTEDDHKELTKLLFLDLTNQEMKELDSPEDTIKKKDDKKADKDNAAIAKARLKETIDLARYRNQIEDDAKKAKQRLQQLRINKELRRQQDEALRAEIAARPTTTAPIAFVGTTPTVRSVSFVESTKPAPLPKIELPKLFDKINELLTSESELLQLSLSAIIARYPTPSNYWQIANEELGADAVAQLKPILDIHHSYLDPGRKEEYTELTKLLKTVNLVSKEQYSPLTRGELLTILDSVNKLMNEEYDPLFSNGIFTTDVTSGPRNTIDETVLHAYEEKLAALKGTSYGSFIQELKETNSIKNLGMGKLELRRRVECKLSLSANDYHIIRAYRNLKGSRVTKVVTTEALEIEIRSKHLEFKWDEISDLNARLEDLKKYYPKLLGIPESQNKSNGELIIGIHCPGLSLLGFKDGTCPTTSEVFWARDRLKKRDGDEVDVVYEQFKAHRGRLKIIVTVEHTVGGKPQEKQEERHVDNGAYRELCEQFQANKEKNK